MAKDVDLFAAAMAGVKPLKGRKRGRPRKHCHPEAEGRGTFEAAGKVPRCARDDKGAGACTLDDQNFDRDIARALSRGKLVPQASLDLHGMTLAAAERAVADFLERRHRTQDLRVVLIVTGKGLRLEGGRMLGGRIRGEFVGWLNRADNRQRGCAPCGRRTRGTAAAAPSTCCCAAVRRPAAAPCAPRPSDSRSARRSRRRRDGRE